MSGISSVKPGVYMVHSQQWSIWRKLRPNQTRSQVVEPVQVDSIETLGQRQMSRIFWISCPVTAAPTSRPETTTATTFCNSQPDPSLHVLPMLVVAAWQSFIAESLLHKDANEVLQRWNKWNKWNDYTSHTLLRWQLDRRLSQTDCFKFEKHSIVQQFAFAHDISWRAAQSFQHVFLQM